MNTSLHVLAANLAPMTRADSKKSSCQRIHEHMLPWCASRGFRMLPVAFVHWMMLHWPPTYTTTPPSIQRSLKRPIQASPSTWPRSCKSLPGRPPLCYTVGNELSTPVDIHRYRHVNRRRPCQGIERLRC